MNSPLKERSTLQQATAKSEKENSCGNGHEQAMIH
jgi:hypothetical protein